jgi:hypothetical protein
MDAFVLASAVQRPAAAICTASHGKLEIHDVSLYWMAIVVQTGRQPAGA